MNRCRSVESVRTMLKPGRGDYPGTSSEGALFTVRAASGIQAAGTQFRLLCGTCERVTLVPRECRKWLSTNTGYTDGATRSSDERPVMGRERRGCPMPLASLEQPNGGGLR